MYQLEQPHEKGVFIQGITMENHGLYLNKFDPSEWNIDFTSDTLSEEESNPAAQLLQGRFRFGCTAWQIV